MVKMISKIVVCMIMMLGIVLSPSVLSYASTDGDGLISVDSVDGSKVIARLMISGTKADIVAKAKGVAGTSKISADIVLQVYEPATKKWNNVRTWEKTVKSSTLSFEKDYTLYHSGTYRVKLVAKITKDGHTETITSYSSLKEH